MNWEMYTTNGGEKKRERERNAYVAYEILFIFYLSDTILLIIIFVLQLPNSHELITKVKTSYKYT